MIAATTPSQSYFKRLAIAVLVFSIALIAYYSCRSLWLDHWDSVQFALAIDTYDISLHQPHPPGYPAYVYLAKFFHLLLADHRAALVALSVLSGAVSVALVYLLVSSFSGTFAALLAAAFLFLAPAHFQSSLVATTDVVVGPFLLGGIVLCIFAHRSRSNAGAWVAACAGFLFGWGVGVRPQSVFVLALAVLFSIHLLRSWRRGALLMVGGLAGTLAWLVPVSISHGGFWSFVSMAQGQYNRHPDVRMKFGFEAPGDLLDLLARDWGAALAVLTVGGVVAILASSRSREAPKAHRPRPPIDGIAVFSLLWLVAACCTILAFHPTTQLRIAVIAMYPLAILAGWSYGRLAQPHVSRGIRLCVWTCSVVLLLVTSVATMGRGGSLHMSTPPPVEGARFIRERFAMDEAVLIADSSWRHWSYYLPEFRTERSGNLPKSVGAFRYVIADYALPNLIPRAVHQFQRSLAVYDQHSPVDVYIYATGEASIVFDRGAYSNEQWGYWVSDEATGQLINRHGDRGELRLRIRSALGIKRRVDLRIDGVDKWSSDVGVDYSLCRIPLDPASGWKSFHLSTPDGCIRPSDVSASNDSRCLALGISQFEIVTLGYELGERIQLNRDHAYLVSGWSRPESWGSWTDAGSATLALRLPSRPAEDLELKIDGHFYVHPTHPGIQLEVVANGTTAALKRIEYNKNHTNPEFVIPAKAIDPDGSLTLEFRFAGLASPVELGLADDSRKLGLAVRSFTLDAASP